MSWRFDKTPSCYVQPRVAHSELLIVIFGSSSVELRIVVPAILPGGKGFSLLEELVIGGGGLRVIFPISSSGMPARVAI
jgi:hypothetical protein